MKFALMGFIVDNIQQARTLLLAAMVRGDDWAVKQCWAVIQKLERG